MRTTHLTGWLIGLAVGALLAWMVIGCGSGDDSRAPSSWTFTAPTPTSHLGAAPPTIAMPTPIVIPDLPTFTSVQAGATYTGTHSDGGTVEFGVSIDGRSLNYFDYTGIECLNDNSTLDGHLYDGSPPIRDNKFWLGDVSSDYEIDGRFGVGNTARGGLILHHGSGLTPCTSGEVTWSAAAGEVAVPTPTSDYSLPHASELPRSPHGIHPCSLETVGICTIEEVAFTVFAQDTPTDDGLWLDCVSKYISSHYTFETFKGAGGLGLRADLTIACGIPTTPGVEPIDPCADIEARLGPVEPGYTRTCTSTSGVCWCTED